MPAAMSVCTDQQPSASVADQLGGAEEMGASKEYVRVRTALGYNLHPDKFQELSKLDLQKKFDLLVRRGIIVTYLRHGRRSKFSGTVFRRKSYEIL